MANVRTFTHLQKHMEVAGVESYLPSKQLKVLELRKEAGCRSAELVQGHVDSIDDSWQVCWGTGSNQTLGVEAVTPASTPFTTAILLVTEQNSQCPQTSITQCARHSIP